MSLLLVHLLLLPFLLVVATTASSAAGDDIRTMKTLLTELFRGYKSGMDRLTSLAEAAEQRLQVMERETSSLEARLEALEDQSALLVVSVEDRMKATLEEKPKVDTDAINSRLQRLEEVFSRTQRATEEIRSPMPMQQQHARIPELEERLQKLEELTKLGAARTCHELKSLGVTKSGPYYLDPDGPGLGFRPVLLHCDMRTGTTRLDHDTVGEIRVSSCREKGCFVHRVQYAAPMGQITAVLGLSGHCEQHLRYDCLGAPLNAANASSNAWWTDRRDRTHTYWAGSGSDGGGDGGRSVCSKDKCNCDANNGNGWETDEGHLTNRNELPVTRLNFGEVDGRAGRAAKFQLGPVYCSGSSASSSPAQLESCRDLWTAGVSRVGYYMVKPSDSKAKYPKVVFCDMSKEPGVTGFERIFGSPGNLRYFAAFDVSLDQPFYDDYRYINFTSAAVNTGNSFDTRDGVFRAPYSGTYMFSVHAMPVAKRPFMVQIHRNGDSVAVLSNGENGSSMVGQSILLEVAVGDEIRLFNFGGDIYDDVRTTESFFHFVGVLLSSSDRE